MSTPQIDVVDDPARACAAMLLGPLLGGGEIVITGGSTPAAAYQELAAAVRMTGQDVTDAVLWFSDERCVAPDDERSNFALLKRSFLDPLGEAAAPDVVRIEGELGAGAAAERYEQALHEADPLPFDLVLLGIGPDAHIASMFPDQASLSEHSRLVLGVEEAGWEPFVPRVTMTLPALSRARRVVFLVTGESKASAVLAAFGPDAKPDPHVPATMLVSMADEVNVILDRAAAALL